MMGELDTKVIDIKKPDEVECILGQGNFTILTLDDLAKSLLTASSDIKFGIAMNESKPQLTRYTGNDEDLEGLAAENAKKIGSGHTFVILMKDAFPVNVLNTVKDHPGVVNIYGASENPLQVIIGETDLGRAVLGFVDGLKSTEIESEDQKEERRKLVENIGYKID